MTWDDLAALGIVAVAAAWLVRYFVRRIRGVRHGQPAQRSKPIQITFPDKREPRD